jgi:hypothetical protein
VYPFRRSRWARIFENIDWLRQRVARSPQYEQLGYSNDLANVIVSCLLMHKEQSTLMSKHIKASPFSSGEPP